MNRHHVGREIVKLCNRAASEHRGEGTRLAFAALGRAVAAQGAHVAPAWLKDFEALMVNTTFHDEKGKH